MIDYYTCLNIDGSKITDEQLDEAVRESRRKLLELPVQYGNGNKAYPSSEQKEEMTAVSDQEGSIRTLRFRIDYADGATYLHTWTLDRAQGTLAVYCDSQIPEDKSTIPFFHGKEMFEGVSKLGCLLDDDGFPINGEPHVITFSTRERAVDLIMRFDSCRLPVIYLSVSSTYKYLLDPHELAEKYFGLAHVVYEASDNISSCLRWETFSSNPYGGTAGVIFPGSFRILYVNPKSYTSEKASRKVDYAVRSYMQTIPIPETTSYLGIVNRNLEYEKKGLEDDRDKIKKENQEIYQVFDEELVKSEDRVQRILSRNRSLEKENTLLRKQLSAVKNPALLKQIDIEECYPGEIRNIVLDALNASLGSCHPGSRREQLIQVVLDENGFSHEQQRQKDNIKSLFKKHDTYDASMALDMQKLGFTVEREGNHIVLHYRDCPQNIVVPKTPSDQRSMKNLCFEVLRTFF